MTLFGFTNVKMIRKIISLKNARLGGGGGGGLHMKQTGILVVSLRGVNFGSWSLLWCSGQSANILCRQGLVLGSAKKHRITRGFFFDDRGFISLKLIAYRICVF